jgi:membrane protein
MISFIIDFFGHGIWEVRLKDLSPVKAFLVKDLRVLVLALRGFFRDKCLLRASALTYYSLLSIVPLFALFFGISKGFGLETFVQNQIVGLAERANWPPNVVERYVLFAGRLLDSTKGGLVAGIGVVLLLWTVISILGNIESAFNEIWGVRKSRSPVRKFTDYIAIMVIAPILIVVSSSLNVVVASKIQTIAQRIELLGALSPYIVLLFKFLPYLSIWILLVLNYIVIPNTSVSIRSAILAGVATGTIFQVVEWIYITFQIGVSKYGPIYGSFAAMPLFLAWLQLSWMIVLFGAEVAVADENSETYGFHPDFTRLSFAARKILALKVLHLLVKRFVQGDRPLSASEISMTLEIPVRFAGQLLEELINARLVVETARNGNETIYQPGQPIEKMTIRSALEAYELQGHNPARLANPEDERIAFYMKAIAEEMANSPRNLLVKEI